MSNNFDKLKQIFSGEKSAIKELNYLFGNLKNSGNKQETSIINSQVESLRKYLKKENDNVAEILNGIYLGNPLKKTMEIQEISSPEISEIPETEQIIEKRRILRGRFPKGSNLTGIDKEVLKRLQVKEKKQEKEKIRKPSKYVKVSNQIFQNVSKNFLKGSIFSVMEKDLAKTNIELIPSSYISIMLFTALVSFIVSCFIFLFFMIFSLKEFPFLSLNTESFLVRFPKVFWVMIIIPIAAFLFMYFYPSLERKSAESKINQELPFATIHMATIAGALVEPSKIFSIIISTKEYPALQKEFTKLINFINVYGYDIVNSLRKVASASPSKKLSDLFNGLATTINSGGNLADFFNKRSQTLLFDYRLEREKYIKFSETFMDIYISVVIAAPMMLMLLLMIMKISGLGLSLSSSMISLVMVMGVSIINIVFLVFLHLKQSKEG